AVHVLCCAGPDVKVECSTGNHAEFVVMKQVRVSVTASASVSFTVGANVFALCVSYPLTLDPENVSGAYRTLLAQAAGELRALLEGNEELGVLRDIARLALGARRQAGE